jgi:hypothetical protein
MVGKPFAALRIIIRNPRKYLSDPRGIPRSTIKSAAFISEGNLASVQKNHSEECRKEGSESPHKNSFSIRVTSSEVIYKTHNPAPPYYKFPLLSVHAAKSKTWHGRDVLFFHLCHPEEWDIQIC